VGVVQTMSALGGDVLAPAAANGTTPLNGRPGRRSG
jgi:hypothetical protein